MKLTRKYFLETKYLFFSTLTIITIVIVSVWLSGKADHRSLFQNSIVSTSVLAGSFLLFITTGLYFGLKLKDNVGNILNRERLQRYADKTPKFNGFDFDPPSVGDGIGGVILSILLCIVFPFCLFFPLISLDFSFGQLYYFSELFYIGYFSEHCAWFLKIHENVKEIF
ncbi:hypothetical protein EJ377_20670 [Chryseobacterium arthrosphaerae]|uniref:Uncharacterized protein n=1 Tax=Chryseobacterium arthrosphaerae TaxID=651561 RepID=A0A3S0Q4X0_9FLAO|nr:hypothetical protein EJ377_20670 [Chryseobacterium arthrosphaerae]